MTIHDLVALTGLSIHTIHFRLRRAVKMLAVTPYHQGRYTRYLPEHLQYLRTHARLVHDERVFADDVVEREAAARARMAT